MSNAKLSIAFVRRGYSQSGGAEAYLKRLANGVVEGGHDAQLITTKAWPDSEWPFGVIRRLPSRSVIEFANQLEQMRPQIGCDVLMSLERIWSCDVYRAGDGVHRAWLARRRKFELPLERFVRGLNSKHRHILQLEEALLANRSAARVIVNSQMVKTEIVDLYGYPVDKMDIVRNSIPVGQFRFDPNLREESRDALKVKPDEIALLFAGSGWERKGLRFAIAAMALCHNRKMRLLVAGRGNQRYYKSKRVNFLGEVPDPVRLYSAADIFILPTIYDPFSNACLEALACGLPVITTRSNGFSEIIEDGLHGSVVDLASNVTGLRDAIQFWSQAARRAAVRSTNMQHAAQFDISVNVARTLEILVQAAASAVSTSGKI
ncbi:MAG TPA: glycosyltransferase family 4 protein [Candidatus Baltobacteraceae bacterium]|nr:glycosyltransferase family 4 protein [Candidatus Baltobacteraceae bacterium]